MISFSSIFMCFMFKVANIQLSSNMAESLVKKLLWAFAVLLYPSAALFFMAYMLGDYTKELLEMDSDVLYNHLMRIGMVVCTINLCKIYLYNLGGLKLHACALDEPEDNLNRDEVESQHGQQSQLGPRNSHKCSHCGHQMGAPSSQTTSKNLQAMEQQPTRASQHEEEASEENASSQEASQSEEDAE